MNNKYRVFDKVGYFDKKTNEIDTGIVVEVKKVETIFGTKHFYVLDNEIILIEEAVQFVDDDFYIKTPRGTFIIKKTFETHKQAAEQGFGYWFTYKNHDIYSRTIENKATFGVRTRS